MDKLLFFVPEQASSVASSVDLFFFFMVAVSGFFSAACAAVSCSSIDTVTIWNSSPTFHDSGRRLRTNPSSAIGQSIGQW